MAGINWDTIVAPITGNPPCAVAWIRLSGNEAWRIAASVFKPWPQNVEDRKAIYGAYESGDDGLALPFSAGHSYTGEECVELSMHGSRASIQSVVDACLERGARLAEPGEFTQRAFLNGRIDLTQAEAVRDLIDAQTEIQLRQATRNREGALRKAVETMRDEVLALLAAVEASVDFSEEIGELDRWQFQERIEAIEADLGRLQEGSRMSRVIREGYRVVFAGPPNSGKSSIFNRLLGQSRAIVTDIPGTTRDYIEETADFGGVAVVLVDTAGIRETEDPVEQIGIELSIKAAREADELVVVYDVREGSQAVEKVVRAIGRTPQTVLANKVDLVSIDESFAPLHSDAMPVRYKVMPASAQTGLHVDRLVEVIRREVLQHAPSIGVNERQSRILSEAIAVVAEIESALVCDAPDDLLSVLLRDLAATLGRITGQTAEADMIEKIFHDFCVGK